MELRYGIKFKMISSARAVMSSKDSLKNRSLSSIYLILNPTAVLYGYFLLFFLSVCLSVCLSVSVCVRVCMCEHLWVLVVAIICFSAFNALSNISTTKIFNLIFFKPVLFLHLLLVQTTSNYHLSVK